MKKDSNKNGCGKEFIFNDCDVCCGDEVEYKKDVKVILCKKCQQDIKNAPNQSQGERAIMVALESKSNKRDISNPDTNIKDGIKDIKNTHKIGELTGKIRALLSDEDRKKISAHINAVLNKELKDNFNKMNDREDDMISYDNINFVIDSTLDKKDFFIKDIKGEKEDKDAIPK